MSIEIILTNIWDLFHVHERSSNEQVKYSQLMRNHITGERLITNFFTIIVICNQRGDEKNIHMILYTLMNIGWEN